MGCNCGGGRARSVEYMVSYWDGTKKVYANLADAQRAIREAKGRATMRAVQAGKAA